MPTISNRYARSQYCTVTVSKQCVLYVLQVRETVPAYPINLTLLGRLTFC